MCGKYVVECYGDWFYGYLYVFEFRIKFFISIWIIRNKFFIELNEYGLVFINLYNIVFK